MQRHVTFDIKLLYLFTFEVNFEDFKSDCNMLEIGQVKSASLNLQQPIKLQRLAFLNQSLKFMKCNHFRQ